MCVCVCMPITGTSKNRTLEASYMPADLDLHSSIYSKHQNGCKTELFSGSRSGNSSNPPLPQALNEHRGVAVIWGLPEGCSEVRESPMLSERKYFLRCYFRERILKGQFTKPGKVIDEVLQCLHFLQLGVLCTDPQRKEPFISTKTNCNLHR